MTTHDPQTLFHLDDPAVSREAAINLDGTATEKLMHAIVTLIQERGPLAPWELERAYHDVRGRRDWPIVGFYGVHKRASQLKKQVGVLQGAGDRVSPPVGKAAERLALTVEPVEAHRRITEYMTKPTPRVDAD
ncbi:hypothetical protein [Microbacterium lacus]|uniref:hypothetical protein n=1 Tax=Microbacterium lacus TaxID=415217 RepID=UPI0012FDBB4B|nr:hypothetical protein [Microbacterium lacus]